MARIRPTRACLPLAACCALVACGGGSTPKPIVANDLSLALDEDTTVSGMIAATDPDGGVLAYHASTPPAHGTISVDPSTGEITYTPAPDYFGADSATVAVTSGAKRSLATVRFTIANVPDAPRLAPIADQQNSAYALETIVPVAVVDVDQEPVTVTAVASDATIASVAVAADSKSIVITPLTRGATTVTVNATDGSQDVSTSFSFSIGDVTKIALVSSAGIEASSVALESSIDVTSKVVALTNTADRAIPFTLSYNGHRAFESGEDIADYVRGLPEGIPGESFERKLWRFVRDNTYHDVPINDQQWWYDYWPTLNSLGFGFCSHMSAVFVETARAAGYQARIWGLSGHVVPEIYVDGRWEMFDPDLGVYYFTRDGLIAGVQDLAADTSLITAPTNPIRDVGGTSAYTQMIADIYDDAARNNQIADFLFLAKAPAGNALITLPVGARLLLPGHWTEAPTGYDGTTPYQVRQYRQAALELAPGWTGTISLPWVLWDVQGVGSVVAGDAVFDADSEALRSYLHAPGAAVTSLSVRDNPAGLRLVFMINATWYDMLGTNDVRLTGQDVWAVHVGTADVPSAVDAGLFPAGLRRSD